MLRLRLSSLTLPGLSSLPNHSNVFLKLENLQPSGSFKSRGIGKLLVARLAAVESGIKINGTAATSRAHFYSSSGGNAGLGCVHAAVALGCSATVVVPLSTTEYMVNKICAAGATSVIRQGASWQEADNHLTQVVMPEARSRGETAIYVHPFDDVEIWNGNAGIVKETVLQIREAERHYPVATASLLDDDYGSNSEVKSVDIDAIVCSVGGGGLFCGIMQGLDELGMNKTHVVAMETLGADSLDQSVKQGKLVTLPAITSIATSLGARTVCAKALEYALRDTVSTVVLSDAEAIEACRRFANEERFLVEPACSVCPAICYDGRLKKLLPNLTLESNVVLVICGGSNVSFDILEKYLGQGS